MTPQTLADKLGLSTDGVPKASQPLLTDIDLVCLRKIRDVLGQYGALGRFTISLNLSSQQSEDALPLSLDDDSLEVLGRQMYSAAYEYSNSGGLHEHHLDDDLPDPVPPYYEYSNPGESLRLHRND